MKNWLLARFIVLTAVPAARGSTSERVLRKALCPVANLPAGSMLG